MLRVGIIGSRGYTGEVLLEILHKHPRVKLNYVTARVKRPVALSKIFPQFKNRIDLVCDNFEPKLALSSCDLAFLSLPHTASMAIAPLLSKGTMKIIDLSADYRIADYKLYEAWYKLRHSDKENIKRAVYGLPEIYADRIRKADFIANPGCYASAALLALAPIVKNREVRFDNIIIDAKSGYSGAGRKEKDDPFLSELENNFKAYKVDSHQHSPEINQELTKLAKKKIMVIFIPHLLPIERGILETIYVKIGYSSELTGHRLISLYRKFYKNKPFVRIRKEGEFPQLRDVQYTNFCDIGLKLSQDKKTLIIISAIDNLMKGASGQAVQNMNLMCGFKETEGLL